MVELPRSGHLSSVLATLQPDQYSLVTWPDNKPLMVQGQPGTGKTVIAVHRAMYLTHPQRDYPAPLDRVALIGPSAEYVEHVRPVVYQLSQDQELVSLKDVRSLLVKAAGVPVGRGHRPEERLDTSWELGRFVVGVLRHRRASSTTLGRTHAQQVRSVVESMLDPSTLPPRILDQHAELADWAALIGSWDRVLESDRYLPFLAAVGLALRPPSQRDLFDHVIVDEAQDLRPLEWRALCTYLKPGAGMTLVGDLNQARSDWSASSWASLAEDLQLTDDDGLEPLHTLDTGYRSTRQILAFANQLLPTGERAVRALREGPSPTVEKTTAGELVTKSRQVAETLATQHPSGLVAIITMNPRPVSDQLRRRGWDRVASHTAGRGMARRSWCFTPTGPWPRVRRRRGGRAQGLSCQPRSTRIALHQPDSSHSVARGPPHEGPTQELAGATVSSVRAEGFPGRGYCGRP